MSTRPHQPLPSVRRSDGAQTAAPRVVRAGELFWVSGIRGVDADGVRPATPPEEIALAWRNLTDVLARDDLPAGQVGLVTTFLATRELRAHVDDGWLALYPDPGDRPARKTTLCPLPAGDAVQLQAIGVLHGGRRVVEVDGLAHKGPLPNGARIGDYVFSSVLVPQDRGTGVTPEDPRRQTDMCFDNLQAFMEVAGADVGDVALQWVYLDDWRYQPDMVQAYLRTWPSGGYQPARKTFATSMPSQIQMQVIGRVGGSRECLELPGVSHHDPIPLAARIGPLLCSSGIRASDAATRTGLAAGPEEAVRQAGLGLEQVVALLHAAGGTAADIGLLTALVQDAGDADAIEAVVAQMLPTAPALQVLQLGVKNRVRVQLHVMAVMAGLGGRS